MSVRAPIITLTPLFLKLGSSCSFAARRWSGKPGCAKFSANIAPLEQDRNAILNQEIHLHEDLNHKKYLCRITRPGGQLPDLLQLLEPRLIKRLQARKRVVPEDKPQR